MLLPESDEIAIYTLMDPRKPEIVKYVGRARDPVIRWVQHCINMETSPKGLWVASLRQEGIFPQMSVIDVVHVGRGEEVELKWIGTFPKEHLTNVTTSLGNQRIASPEDAASTDARKALLAQVFAQKPKDVVEASRLAGMSRSKFSLWVRWYDVPKGVHWMNSKDSKGNRLVTYEYDEETPVAS